LALGGFLPFPVRVAVASSLLKSLSNARSGHPISWPLTTEPPHYWVRTATEVSRRSTPPLSVKVTKTRLTAGISAMGALPVAKTPKVGVA
jgi:hypothetical protein